MQQLFISSEQLYFSSLEFREVSINNISCKPIMQKVRYPTIFKFNTITVLFYNASSYILIYKIGRAHV